MSSLPLPDNDLDRAELLNPMSRCPHGVELSADEVGEDVCDACWDAAIDARLAEDGWTDEEQGFDNDREEGQQMAAEEAARSAR